MTRRSVASPLWPGRRFDPRCWAGSAASPASSGCRRSFASRCSVSSTDGVGTKLKVAFRADRHDTVGIDLVAMGVNDVLVHGAEPLYFLDYIGARAWIRPASRRSCGGGARLPGGRLRVDRRRDGRAARSLRARRVRSGRLRRRRGGAAAGSWTAPACGPGDAVVGLASTGLHSNGYSLARKIVFEVMGLALDDPLPGTGRTVADELLEPTRIYVRPVLRALERLSVSAMAHITGGGLTGNVPAGAARGRSGRHRPEGWTVPPVFTTLQRAGQRRRQRDVSHLQHGNRLRDGGGGR